jgi:hypothetical protein
MQPNMRWFYPTFGVYCPYCLVPPDPQNFVDVFVCVWGCVFVCVCLSVCLSKVSLSYSLSFSISGWNIVGIMFHVPVTSRTLKWDVVRNSQKKPSMEKKSFLTFVCFVWIWTNSKRSQPSRPCEVSRSSYPSCQEGDNHRLLLVWHPGFVSVVSEWSTKPCERLEKEKRGEGGTERTREEVNVKR